MHITQSINDVVAFGFIEDPDDPNAGHFCFGICLSTMTAQLWYNHTVYQCGGFLLDPSGSYTCNITSHPNLIVGSSQCADPTPKMIISNTGPDAIVLTRFWFITKDGINYGIESICISQITYTEGESYGPELGREHELNDDHCGSNYKHYKSLCIDADINDCAPYKQIIYFDTSRPGEYITNAIWHSGIGINTVSTAGDIALLTCPPTSSPSTTPTTLPSIVPSRSPSVSPTTSAPTTTPCKISTFGIYIIDQLFFDR